MGFCELRLDHEECLRVASELLCAPVRAVDLSWKMEHILKRQARLESRRGTGIERAIISITDERRGHRLSVGVEAYRIAAPTGVIRVAKIAGPRSDDAPAVLYDFWAVPERDHRRFYRYLRTELRREYSVLPPVMRDDDRLRLWDNTVGFLRHGCDRLNRLGVTPKRGVLLLGEPGNGKTMACRWLRSECTRHGLEWRSVSAEEFDEKRDKASAHELFELDRPGIVFFDDVDMAIRDRNQVGHTREHSTFLGAMDGLDHHHGVAYVFTSNAWLEDLDPAFCRPGRIDLVLAFERPDTALRRRLITGWHAEIVMNLPVDDLVHSSDGLSFAELEEIKKLLVLHQLDTGNWDWPWAWRSFRMGCDDRELRPSFGFARPGRASKTRTLSVSV